MRAKQRYFEELAAIRSEVGGDESEDENYPEGPPEQFLRKRKQLNPGQVIIICLLPLKRFRQCQTVTLELISCIYPSDKIYLFSDNRWKCIWDLRRFRPVKFDITGVFEECFSSS